MTELPEDQSKQVDSSMSAAAMRNIFTKATSEANRVTGFLIEVQDQQQQFSIANRLARFRHSERKVWQNVFPNRDFDWDEITIFRPTINGRYFVKLQVEALKIFEGAEAAALIASEVQQAREDSQ